MAFNLFPQTDFRQMDLNYVLAEVKRAANLTDRVDGLEADVDGLSAEIRDPETGLWKAISDIHAADSSQQAQINALIAAQVFARPEDYGATGDGVADDTAALQAAFNSDKPVYLKATYGISNTVHVNKDKVILCGESTVIKTLGRVTYALRFGDDPTTGPDAAIPGLIQVLWYGGTLTCDTTNYFDYGFSFERCLNSCFYGVTVTNCVGTGFRWGGDYGTSTVADNCIVRGPDSGYYGVNGFLVGRNDQRIYNCSAVNMTTGFYTDRGYVRFEGCYCWLTRARDVDLPNVVAYDILGSNCAVIDSTADTVPTGIKLHPTSRNFYAQGLAWYSATSVVADPTGFTLFKGSEAGLVCNGFVTGVASSPWPDPVRICTDVSGLTIIGFMIPDMTNIQDPDSVTQVSDIAELKSNLSDVEDYLGYARNYFDGRDFTTTNTTNWTIVKDKTSVSFTHNNQWDAGTPTLTLNLPVGEYVFNATYSTSSAFFLYVNNTYSNAIKDGDTLVIESGKTYMFEALDIDSGVTQTITDISIIKKNALTDGVINSIESDVDAIESALNEISENVTMTLSVEMESDTASTAATANGVESAGSGYHTVKFPVNGSDVAHVSVASTNWGNPYYIVCDSNNAVVDVSERSANSSTVSELANFDVTIPNNGSYLIVNYLPTHSVTPTASVTREVLAPKGASYPFAGKKWVAIGDSLTEKNNSASKNYVDWVCEKLGLTCINMGIGGTGYMRGYDTNKAFYQRVTDIPNDADIITIFGSGNDLGLYNQIGTPSDTGTSTICGCINTTLDYIANNYPTVPVVVIAPTIWKDQIPTSNTPMTYYVQFLEEIARKRSLHFLNLYSGGGLNPNNAVQLNTLFYHKTLDGNADGVHPNNAGHKIIAPKIKNAIECALIAD